jgi:hypothetical protein
MIKSITSTIPTFKALTFGKGLNILLADLTEKSTDKQTRNSAGKTSMIEIMHFLMGSDADKARSSRNSAKPTIPSPQCSRFPATMLPSRARHPTSRRS